MLKSELIEALSAKQSHLDKKDIEMAINCILEQMVHALKTSERIEIRGFGSFTLHHRAAHSGRNPKTGETLSLAAKSVVYFKPGKELKERVDASRDNYVILD
jgi:integration host factor subunit beta